MIGIGTAARLAGRGMKAGWRGTRAGMKAGWKGLGTASERMTARPMSAMTRGTARGTGETIIGGPILSPMNKRLKDKPIFRGVEQRARRAGMGAARTARNARVAAAPGRGAFGWGPRNLADMSQNPVAAYQNAYDKRIALSAKRAGIGIATYGVGMSVSNRGQTRGNQGTFAARRMRQQNVGISTGALQAIDYYSRAIGGQT